MQNFDVTIPLSLYIHIPWCVRKCPYCDFNSHEAQHDVPEDLYIEALLNDLDEQLPAIWGRRIVSIFFGGGTPSLFSAGAIEKILTGVHHRLRFGPQIEITLEANPGTVDEKRFQGFRQAGVNRLSIGVQSLQDEKLHALGRIHNREYALRAIDAAINAGFDNFNLDLMHGLPAQSIEDALSDLQDALAFQPPHLSWYQLTIEPNTFFHHQPPRLPEDDVLWEIQEQGKEKLKVAGLHQYEISAYAKSDRECVHNVNYWEFGDYLGIGAGAHSKLTDVSQQIITRHSQLKNPKDYLNPEKKFTTSTTVLSEEDIRFEFMLNALRLTRGVSAELFTERTGLPLSSLEPILTFAKEKELMMNDPAVICATEQGLRFLNDVISLFLPRKSAS
ncbi:MAG: radical SAM family heme chaperone HemW [Gammaproteobacteria bacterium]